MILKFAFAFGALSLAGACSNTVSAIARPEVPPTCVGQDSRRAAMHDFARIMFSDRNPRLAYERFAASSIADPIARRNVAREDLVGMLERMVRIPGSVFEVQHIIVDDDLTVVNYYGAFDATKPGADVAEFFRWEGCKIVEHWAVLQVRPGAAPSR